MIAYLIESGFTPVEAYEYMGPRPVETRSSRIEYQVVALDTAVVKRLYKLTPNSECILNIAMEVLLHREL